ncbi:MAG TPA: DUF1802 family protein [Gemmatimonadaceae bacterium]|nr:DUF1802 family protein [Gemmatimonadaceae bacterium]
MSTSTMVERTALKEWAVLCDAMGRGDIIAMVRKGGIREQRAGFAVRHDRFVLYPTYFHARETELAPRFRSTLAASEAEQPPSGVIRVSLVADVAAVWAVRDLDALRAIEQDHGLDWSAVESRFNYRGVPGVQVVAVRVSRLPNVADVPEIRRYAGCVSWVELADDVDVSGTFPVLSDAAFDARLASLRSALGEATQ